MKLLLGREYLSFMYEGIIGIAYNNAFTGFLAMLLVIILVILAIIGLVQVIKWIGWGLPSKKK